jgi:hypothetical protein
MLFVFRSFRVSTAWRATYLVCGLLVFSYILFEVLDLDGSNFLLKHSVFERAALERAPIVAEAAGDTSGAYSLEKILLRGHFSALSPDTVRERIWVRLRRSLTFSLLNSVRTHGYRLALPRSSTLDPFPLL